MIVRIVQKTELHAYPLDITSRKNIQDEMMKGRNITVNGGMSRIETTRFRVNVIAMEEVRPETRLGLNSLKVAGGRDVDGLKRLVGDCMILSSLESCG